MFGDFSAKNIARSIRALVFSFVDMSLLRSSSIYCRFAPIRYEINPSFAKQTYRVRQHISNAAGVYRKSRKGFISIRVILNGEHALLLCLYHSPIPLAAKKRRKKRPCGRSFFTKKKGGILIKVENAN